MTSLTLSVPEAIKRRMHEYKYINWSEIVRIAISDKIQFLEKIDKILSKSPLTEEDTIKYGRLIKKRQWKKTKQLIQ